MPNIYYEFLVFREINFNQTANILKIIITIILIISITCLTIS